ncbi:MAG: YqcI/YcgG family protein [Salinarimonas sp.]
MYHSKAEIRKNLCESTWQHKCFSDFENTLIDQKELFPCTFAISGVKADQIRFAFMDSIDCSKLAKILTDYINNSRKYGRNTSLVIFERPQELYTIKEYESYFWKILKRLKYYDDSEWPENIPIEITDPHWEFCFAGEPMFVVCNTPAHHYRKSRYSPTFMLTFQPRWVFYGIEKNIDLSNGSENFIRKRIKKFDLIPPSPCLGKYGSSETLEYQQYFLDETNDIPPPPSEYVSGIKIDKGEP